MLDLGVREHQRIYEQICTRQKRGLAVHIFCELWLQDVNDKPRDVLFCGIPNEEQMLKTVEGRYELYLVFAK